MTKEGSPTQPEADDTPQAGTAASTKKPKAVADKPWAPLAFPMYRTFWIAGLFSNLGTWMHETGAQWMMNSMDPSPEMVSAVRTCMTIPVFCLALPAGVWADRFNRRYWLLGTQSLLLVIACAMAALTYTNLMTPFWLLVFSLAMGAAMILNQPAWQALTPELVPAALVPTAVSVGSISFNLARAIGPALAGLLIAQVGIWAAFGFNAISFLGIIIVLYLWRPEPEAKPRKPPQFNVELKKGMFLIKHSLHLKNALIRVAIFAVPASILWSLISLVATEKLLYAERGFGLCLGLIGTGAVVGAWFLPGLRARMSSEKLLLVVQIIYALACLGIGLTDKPAVILPAFTLLGASWMATMTTLNATTQVNLPRKFRARGMAAFLMAFALGMAAGSLLWGWLGLAIGIGPAFVVAGICLAITAFATFSMKVGSLQIEPA